LRFFPAGPPDYSRIGKSIIADSGTRSCAHTVGLLVSSTPQNDGYGWGEVAPDLPPLNPEQQYHLARQVRIMFAAGKGRREINSWLQRNGLSPAQTAVFLAEFPEPGQSERWERFFSRTSLAAITVFSLAVLALVLVRQPWDETRWTWTHAGSEIHPVLGFVLFCFLFPAAMSVLWYLPTRFGRFLDQYNPDYLPRGLGIMLFLVCLLTALALTALFTLG